MEDAKLSPRDVLCPLGAALSLVCCGVVAAVMLASDLRKASWSPYVLLWALAQSILQILTLVETIVLQVWPGESASTVGCEIYVYLRYVLPFLSMAAMALLSVDRLVSSAKLTCPVVWGRRGPRYMALGLLLAALLVYSPLLVLIGAIYYHDVHICATNTGGINVYYHGYYVYTFIVADPLGLLVVLVGGGGFCWLERRKRERSEHQRLVVPFLLGFFIVALPPILLSFLLLIEIHQYLPVEILYDTMNILQVMYLVCTTTQPIFLLGCLSTSAIFRRGLRSVFLPLSRRPPKDNQGIMTEMTELDEET